MTHRYASASTSITRLRPASALREALSEGYHRRDLRADITAGLVVGVVALPLSMALAIASGVPPQQGLYTAIVAGIAIAFLGGSRVQVSGPTAAFVVVLAPIAARFGIGGLLIATFLAGLLQIAMGVGRLGRYIQFIPHPVTAGFTAGIALVIGTLQLKDFLGLDTGPLPAHYIERIVALLRALPTSRVGDAAVGTLTLAALLLWPRVTRRVPGPLVALVVGALGGIVLAHLAPTLRVATIQSTFTFPSGGGVGRGIPRVPPIPLLPWSFPGPDGEPLRLSLDLFRSLLPPAFAIAILGAIESLLSAVVADGMTGGRHDPDAELVAQGTGNVLVPWFGGIAATGAIARTATNVRSGARSPIAAIFHGIFVLVVVLALAPLLGHLPMASLAALLLIVAWNMGEARHVLHTIRVAPKSDALVLVSCFALTVLFDMVVAVSVGVLLASLLFMKRMAEVAEVRLVSGTHPSWNAQLPRGILLYEIGGPLFFAAAEKAMGALRTVEKGIRVVILDLRAVPAMDITGLVSLESAVQRLCEGKVLVILAGVQPQPLRLLAKAGWRSRKGRLAVYRSFDRALTLARAHVGATAD